MKQIKFIPEIIINYLQENSIDFITSLPKSQNDTINDVVKHCIKEGIKHGKNDIDFEILVRQAISIGYDKRYFAINEMKDERNVIINEFTNSFIDILKQLNIINIYKNQDVIIVGIGNGFEGKMLYMDIKKLVLVDIAPDSLNQAQKFLPQSTTYQEGADKLTSILDNSFDLYISLRTYQSTYFDIQASLQEAKRILRNNGVVIISIACGYTNDKNEFVYGLFNPHNGILEKDRPDMFLNTIKQHLMKLEFKIIGIKKIQSEIFIYATKYVKLYDNNIKEVGKK